MDPTAVAAWIAASVSFFTLIGTVITQIIGFRATKADTEQQIKAQSEQLDKTLAEQRTRTLNERFATASEQLGSDKPAVRLAGVYAMAGLADDWEENRQTCVDVLCAYLRMPYEPNPGEEAPEPQGLPFRAIREVRHTVIRVITPHLRNEATASWQGLNFDFTGTVFDGGDFNSAQFIGGKVDFTDARFTRGEVDFSGARFTGTALFTGVEFCGSDIDFTDAEFTGGVIGFHLAQFPRGLVNFSRAQFSGGQILFENAEFSGSVLFHGARFSGATVSFSSAQFLGGTVDFSSAQFSGGEVGFHAADFSGCTVRFRRAEFSGCKVEFPGAGFLGGMVDFSDPSDWSFRPAFPLDGRAPSRREAPSSQALIDSRRIPRRHDDIVAATKLANKGGWGPDPGIVLNCNVLPLNIKGASRFLQKWPSATLDIEPPEALWPENKGQAASLARVRAIPLCCAAGHGRSPRTAEAFVPDDCGQRMPCASSVPEPSDNRGLRAAPGRRGNRPSPGKRHPATDPETTL